MLSCCRVDFDLTCLLFSLFKEKSEHDNEFRYLDEYLLIKSTNHVEKTHVIFCVIGFFIFCENELLGLKQNNYWQLDENEKCLEEVNVLLFSRQKEML